MRTITNICCLIDILYSCSTGVSKTTHFSEQSTLSESDNEKYWMMRSLFDKALTTHFPDRPNGLFTLLASEDTSDAYVGITLIEYNSDAPEVINPEVHEVSNPCVVPFHKLAELTSIPEDCALLILPDVESDRFGKFNDRFEYHFVSQNNKAVRNEYHLDPNPTTIKELKHGISQGYAYNSVERIAVYWGIIW